jgi:hypothetical protein
MVNHGYVVYCGGYIARPPPGAGTPDEGLDRTVEVRPVTEPSNPAATGEVVPDLLGYTTWFANGSYHARFKAPLPQAAVAASCLEEVTAATNEGLTAAATRNRVRITVWLTGRWAELRETQEQRARRGRS